ncbi:MAG: aspartate/tyrosine/aromatic aminotransferase [Candidatus Latescibacteria bacterium]|nr:aspartate/tyrosine/aromatic aminotransferase [Candidatus Latescibacterota bacterium]
MLEQLSLAPSDPILGLTDAFRKDPNPNKINLGVGVYKDEKGHTPILASVAKARQRVLAAETTKNYLAIDGSPEYSHAVQELLFGADHALLSSGRVVTAQAPGGTGALRVAADFLHQHFTGSRVWISEPTWANHGQIFRLAGIQVQTYPYFDAQTNSLAIDALCHALDHVPPGDVVLLHGCCHNPTGVDPTAEEWRRIASVLAARQLLPLVDFAYQGLGRGLREDAAGLLILAEALPELLVASSFSKNFGLYNERVGALTIVAPTAEAAQQVLSHVKISIRANYSNPPAHGAAVITTVLSDPQLRQEWEEEVKAMRERIAQMRALFVATLKAKGVKREFSFIERQQGMFSFSGLGKEQVEALRQQHGVYIVGGGRINVAGMTRQNMEPLCTAIAAVLS